MKYIFFIIGTLLAFNACNASKNAEQEQNTTQTPKPIEKQVLEGELVGKVKLEYLTEPPYANWFNDYKTYKPKPEIIAQLKEPMEDVKLEVFFGTWCIDSQREVPSLVAILNAIDYDVDSVTFIGVGDGGEFHKKSPDGEEVGKNINYVPTIIFYRNGKEINRIVEQTRETLEEDMLNIVTGEDYSHYYN